MKRVTIPASELAQANLPGAVLCRDLTFERNGRRVTSRRGTPIDSLRAEFDAEIPKLEIHLLVPERGDIIQEEASARIARAIAGNGLLPTDPHQGQVDLRAAQFGLLRIASSTVTALNATGTVLIATGLDGRVVEPDETVAIVKAAELLVPSARLDEILSSTDPSRPAIDIAPFRRTRVALIAGERIREANLKVSSQHLAAGLDRFDAELTDVRRSNDVPNEIAALYRDLLDQGAELILVAGSIVLDPEDPYLEAIGAVDGRLVRRGAPIDPGTMFWVAYLGDDVPVFGLASCEMYGRLSIFDLFLPYALANQTITSDLIGGLGYGGLLNDTQISRRPASWRETGE